MKIRAEIQAQLPISDGDLPHQWIWGAAGTGKTSRAFAENPGAYLNGVNQWWDGYVDQETVIVDDMDPFHKKLAREFKIWADRYPFPAEVKGGTIVIRPKKLVVTLPLKVELKGAIVEFVARTVWITCPYHPEKLYEEREDIAQLIRRIDNVREFKNGETIIEFLT